MCAREWITADETAREMLLRVQNQRSTSFPLLPPLHRVPLFPGNVLELTGPSPSAKTHILMQSSIQAILPQNFGGCESLSVYIDLDCRFDVCRFAQLLKHRLTSSSIEKNLPRSHFLDDELFDSCLKRFRYIRCYNSLEFLSTLKTLNDHLTDIKNNEGINVHTLIIDSIGAFYWMDRASANFQYGGDKRKCFSLQTVSETVVMELKKVLKSHSLLVIASKTNVFSGPESDRSSSSKIEPRDYMPSVWQKFVTHRVLLSSFGDNNAYCLEWKLPPLKVRENFVVNDAGVMCI